MHVATLIRGLAYAGHWATVFILGRLLQIGGSDDSRDLLAEDPDLSQGSDEAVGPGLEVAPIQLHDVIRQRIRAEWPPSARPLPWCGAPLAHPMPHLVRLAARQAHEGPITQQQGWQGIHARDAKQDPQAIEQAGLDERHHRALARRTLDLAQLGARPSSCWKEK